MNKAYTSRTPAETFQRCPRRRYLAQHFNHTGIESVKRPLPLAVGSAVHAGLAELLRGKNGDAAVQAALAEFGQATAAGLELDASEAPTAPATTIPQAVQTFGDAQMDSDMAELSTRRLEDGRAGFDAYLATEQANLVEGMVRAYARRRLQPLLEQFEVLEVEREGEWTLHEWQLGKDGQPMDLVFQSRPDALLLEKDSRQLYLLSFKTTAGWDSRKARNAEHDMQGLTEGIEIERRLGEWWQVATGKDETAKNIYFTGGSDNRFNISQWLCKLPAPPRILAVRYEYLLKGSRWVDKDLSARFGFECRSQRSPLVRAYKGQGKSAAQGLNWSWDYLKEDGSLSKLSWQNWKSIPVWEEMRMRNWIDKLNDAAIVMGGEDATVGMAPRELGWKSAAQATGYTATHPLDDVFLPPVVVYRNEDDLRDLVDSLEYQERGIVEHLAELDAAPDDGERRHLLNIHFPMVRSACEYPSRCGMVPLCFGGADIRANPLGSGLYKIREKNHPEGGE